MPDDDPITENEPTEGGDTDPTEGEGSGEGSDSQETETETMELIPEPSGCALTGPMPPMDYIDSDGNLHLGATPRRVMITSSDDLEDLPEGLYPPGSEAFTADETGKWRLSAAGTWTSLIAEAAASEST